jgi:outer membrane protein W
MRRRNKPPVIVSEYKKKYEVGILAGNAIYYGTLSNQRLFSNDFNSVFGLQFRYSLKKNLSLSISILQATLTGSDLRSGDTSKVSRGMSFKTPTRTLSIQFEYDFFNNRIYSSNMKFRPSIGFGVDYIMFTPMGEFLGEWYSLQPMGTGGQTIANPQTLYATSTLGAPVTAQLRYYVNKKTIFSFFATYHLAFTNYLDDVGPDPYPDPIAIGLANPDNPERAKYFANPTNRFVKNGQLRSGAADVSDGFFTFGFTLAHHF